MLAPSYIRNRMHWYKPILARGDDPAQRCRLDVLRLPIRTVGEDAREYVPYALHSQLLAEINGAVRRLQDCVEAYLVRGEKVSPHQLPSLNADSRALMQHLRAIYPDLPPHLLHHWCADPKGGMALLALWRNMWAQAAQQEKLDRAPWLAAVNTLLLKHMRAAVTAVPSEQPEQTDLAMQAVIGGAFLWALQGFLKQQATVGVAMERIGAFESLMVPVTAMAFMYRQAEGALLGDSRHIIHAYGLEPELVPRMRELREQVAVGQEVGMLSLLAQDRLGDHLLKRCWARLSLWCLAEETGSGAWMRWVREAKLMDQLLADPARHGAALVQALTPLAATNNFARWFLAQAGKGAKSAGDAAPWRRDEISVHAFLVFDEDVRVEVERRQAERMWLDQRERIADKVRGAEADRVLANDYNGGKLVFFQPDFTLALHSGKALAAAHACLAVDWSNYLAALDAALGEDMDDFLANTFIPGLHRLFAAREDVFVDALAGIGCQLRGAAQALLAVAGELRRLLGRWHAEQTGAEPGAAAVPMALALGGDWRRAKIDKEGKGFMFSLALTQADHLLAHDEGLRRFFAARDKQAKLRPAGRVRILGVDAAGKKLPLLYNGGLAITAAALQALMDELKGSDRLRIYRVPREEASAALSGFRLPPGQLDLVAVTPATGEEGAPMLIMRVGQALLAGELVTLHEVLEPDSPFCQQLIEVGLRRWQAMAL